MMESSQSQLVSLIVAGKYAQADEIINSLILQDQDSLDRDFLLSARLLALIGLERYSTALELLKGKEKPADFFLSLESYCYYRMKKYNEAISVLSLLEDTNSVVATLLKAQTNFKLGHYKEALALLLKAAENEINPNLANLIEINIYAAFSKHNSFSMSGDFVPTIKTRHAAGEDYEFFYNAILSELFTLHSLPSDDNIQRLNSADNKSLDDNDEIGFLVRYISLLSSSRYHGGKNADELANFIFELTTRSPFNNQFLRILSDLVTVLPDPYLKKLSLICETCSNEELLEKYSLLPKELYRILVNLLLAMSKELPMHYSNQHFKEAIRRVTEIQLDTNSSVDQTIFDLIQVFYRRSPANNDIGDDPLFILEEFYLRRNFSLSSQEALERIVARGSELKSGFFSSDQRKRFLFLSLKSALLLDNSGAFLQSSIAPILLETGLLDTSSDLFDEFALFLSYVAFVAQTPDLLSLLPPFDELRSLPVLAGYLRVHLYCKKSFVLNSTQKSLISSYIATMDKGQQGFPSTHRGVKGASSSHASKKKRKQREAYLDKLRLRNNGVLPPYHPTPDRWLPKPKAKPGNKKGIKKK